MHEVTRRRLKGVAGGAALGFTALVAAVSLTEEGRGAVGRLVRRVAPQAERDPDAIGTDDVGTDEVVGSPQEAVEATPVVVPATIEGALAKIADDVTRLRGGEITAIEFLLALNALRDAGLGLLGACPPTGGGRRWRHVKRGSEYDEVGRATLHFMDRAPIEDEVLLIHSNAQGYLAVREGAPGAGLDGVVACRATLQVATRPLVQGDVIVIYRGAEGRCWARLREEFEDGRFEPL